LNKQEARSRTKEKKIEKMEALGANNEEGMAMP